MTRPLDERPPLTYRIQRRLRRPVAAVARLIGHAVILPVDLAFVIFDLLYVNAKKTNVFRHDCRGPFGRRGGGPCPPCRKYTNRWVFRMVCADTFREPGTPDVICKAGVTTTLYWLRGGATLLCAAALAVALAWGLVRYWPRAAGSAPDAAAVERLRAERLTAADDALKAGNHEAALGFLKMLIQSDPGNRELCYKAAQCCEKLGDTEGAVAYYLVAARDPAVPAALGRLPALLWRRGDIQRAGRLAEKAQAGGVADADCLAVLADWRLWNGLSDETADLLARAGALDANNALVRLVSARLLVNQKKLPEAEKAYSQLANYEQYGPLGELYKAELLIGREDSAGAAARIREVLDRYPNLAWLRLHLIELAFAAGRKEEALAEADRVLKLASATPAARLLVARSLMMHGEDVKAFAIARQVGREDPDHAVAASVLRATIYLKRGLPDFALAEAEDALARKPDAADALLVAGQAQSLLGRPKEAAALYAQAIQAGARSEGVERRLGMALRQTGDTAQAIEHLKRAVELAPGSGPARQEYGLALLSVGRRAEAKAQLAEAAKLPPVSVETLTALGIISQEEGDRAAAQSYYSKAVEANAAQAAIAANNLAFNLLSEGKDLPMALALAWLAYTNSHSPALLAASSDTLSSALIASGHAAQALNVARLALKYRPDDPGRLARFAAAASASGDQDAAIKALERIETVAPNSKEAELARKTIETLKKTPPAAEPNETPATPEGGARPAPVEPKPASAPEPPG